MELFGWVCSPLCKAKAESHGIAVPVFEGQKSVVEARLWRRLGRVGLALGAGLVLLAGFWGGYRWFGSVPKPVFSVRFAEPSYSGQSAFAGAENDQIVFCTATRWPDTNSSRRKRSGRGTCWTARSSRSRWRAAHQEPAGLNFRLRDQGDTDGVKNPLTRDFNPAAGEGRRRAAKAACPGHEHLGGGAGQTCAL
jgi:hypothetical protein